MDDRTPVTVTILEYIGNQIREAREEMGLTQARLARKVGCERYVIYKLETAKPVHVNTLLVVLDGLDMGLAVFPRAPFRECAS